MMQRRHLCVIAALALFVASSVAAHEGATGVVKARMEAMESMAKAMKAIDQRLMRKRDLEMMKADAKSVQEGAEKMLSLFPAGTGGYPSEARAQVWQKWPDFEAKARALAAESGKLAETDPRDLKALNAQSLRVSDACGNCHELYRAKRHQH
jgi:cytochrome c556